MGRDGKVGSRKQQSLSWMIAMRLIALFVALGLALSLTAPALAKTADGDTVLAFTSDVHNRAANQSRDRLSAWVDGLSSSIGHFDFMGFCGDMGDATNNATTHDEFWATAKDAFDLMDTKTDKIDAIYYTTGNHEFSPGNFDTTTNACKNYYTVNAEAVNGDDYRIYCLGCDSKSQSYSGDQVTALSNYLAACGTDKPIFVMTHYPLHYLTKGNRSTSNAKGVIDALNAATEAGKTVVLLWGHNHSQGDTRYDHIYEPKTTIDYARNQSTAFNFYYMAAGCMSDDEYVGSSSVEGKGLIVTIDHKTGAITFAYYKKDLTIGKSLTTEPTVPVTKYKVTWVDGDGATIKTEQVAEGETPSYTGNTPTKTPTARYSYTFTGWDPTPAPLTADATYTAQFTEVVRTYAITWVDGDGKTLKTDQVAYGETPAYTGNAPTKQETDEYTYEFDGTWDPAVVAVTEDATYTAHFTATKITPEPPTPQDKWVRLSGQGRYQTMSAIVSEGFKTSSSVVLASGEKFADALVASALAGALDCPIVLTATDELSPEAKQQVMSLHASTVYVVGGRAVISQEVRDQLELLPDVEQLVPLAGKNRTETSRVVADAVVSLDHGVDTVVVATGKNFADALVVSPWCYARHYPIILTGDDGNLTAGQVDDIAGRYAAKHVVIVGGVGAVSQDAQDALEAKSLQVNRWKGKGRYETSAVIAGHVLDDGMSLAHVAVATGNAFPDALAGAALCGRLSAPLLLATDKSDAGLVALDIIREGKADVKQGYVLGGKGSVSDEVFELLEDITE